jgi:hypothetical protein
VTRQGTNEFHGDVNFFLQTDGMTGNNSDGLVNPDGTFVNACADGWDAALDPRQVPRLHRAARRPHRQGQALVLRVLPVPADAQADLGAPLDDPLSFKRYYDDRYLFKLNWQVSPRHKW